jgi:hydrogenase-4 component F
MICSITNGLFHNYVELTLLPLILGAINGFLLLWVQRRGIRKSAPFHQPAHLFDSLFLSWESYIQGPLTLLVSIILFVASFIMIPDILTQNCFRESYTLPLVRIPIDIYIDALSLFFMLVINSVTLAASWNALDFLKKIAAQDTEKSPENLEDKSILQTPEFFHFSINLFHFTMLLVVIVDNLILLWIAIELTTLVSALLVSYRNKLASWDAGTKYLFLTSTGIILALVATIFMANAFNQFKKTAAYDTLMKDPQTEEMMSRTEDASGGVTYAIMDWSVLREVATYGGSSDDIKTFLELSFLFVLVGYGTKAGLAPMHTWVPDGHSEAPPPISALLSGVLLKSALYAILRFYTLANLVGNPHTNSILLLIAGLFSLVIATPFIVKEKIPMKRVLAYHTVEHMAIIVFGIGMGGLGLGIEPLGNRYYDLFTKLAFMGSGVCVFGALFHTLNHALTKALMFLDYGLISSGVLDGQEVRGAFYGMPAASTILVFGGLALVGMPPFSIFLSEFIILWGGLKQFLYEFNTAAFSLDKALIVMAIVIFIVTTTLIFFGLVRHMSKLLQGLPQPARRRESLGELAPMLLLIATVVIFGFGFGLFPSLSNLIWNSTQIVILGR